MSVDEESAAGTAENIQRVAVFVDVENILGWLKRGGCGELLERAQDLGLVSVRRAFGDFSNPTVASRQVELQRHGFDLVHTLHPAKGKSNSADISMTIDIMECCREPEIQWVLLATGDSDFGPVFRRLRELGKGVVGVGPSSVLSSSVQLSCHQFVFTDDNNKNKNGGKRKGKGGKGGERAAHTPDRGAAAGTVSTRIATPPQLLSSRGGFRVKHQGFPLRPAPPPDHTYASEHRVRGNTPEKVRRKKDALGWTVVDSFSTPPAASTRPPPVASMAPLTKTAKGEKYAVKPFLAPGQLLLPNMLTASAAPAPKPPASFVPPPPSIVSSKIADGEGVGVKTGQQSRTQPKSEGFGGGINIGGGGGERGARPAPLAFSRPAALSVVRPSEKLYRHLLALDHAAEAGTGSLANDWGHGLTDVTLARGLVSLAQACGSQDRVNSSWASVALSGLAGGGVGNSAVNPGQACGFEREEAFRVARLLQRCGFLSWVAEEQQWLVTVPSDVEVLRRRRDDTMMEELLTRCQEAGVPFEPSLAANLKWSKRP